MNQTAIALAPPGWIAQRDRPAPAMASGLARAFAKARSSRTLHLVALVCLMTTFLTNVVNLLTGTLGQSIAVIAVAGVGIAWALGQASPRFALGTVVGVAILFSSAWIVGQISGNGGG
jgi:type IV secretory pathway VirB2 component (pilin)